MLLQVEINFYVAFFMNSLNIKLLQFTGQILLQVDQGLIHKDHTTMVW